MSFFNKDVVDFPVTEISGLEIKQKAFTETATKALYERIIFSVIKDINASDEKLDLITLSASNDYSPASYGFVHFLAWAMAGQKQVFLEKVSIQGQFIFKRTESSRQEEVGIIELDFRKFEQAILLKEYYGMLFLALDGAAKGIRISQGLLLKISRLSEMMADKRQVVAVEAQLNQVSEALRDAKTAYLDAGSDAGFATFDTEPSSKAIDFVYQLLSNLTGYSIGFLKGEKSGSSLSDTGESDKKQNREATEFYFLSVIQAVLEAIFKETFKLKPMLDNLEILPSMLATIEMWSEGSIKGKEFLYSQLGLRPEHLDLSKPDPVVKTDEVIINGSRAL